MLRVRQVLPHIHIHAVPQIGPPLVSVWGSGGPWWFRWCLTGVAPNVLSVRSYRSRVDVIASATGYIGGKSPDDLIR